VARAPGEDITISERGIDINYAYRQAGRVGLRKPAARQQRAEPDAHLLGRDTPLVAPDPLTGLAYPQRGVGIAIIPILEQADVANECPVHVHIEEIILEARPSGI
jgi:hypothetical protein